MMSLKCIVYIYIYIGFGLDFLKFDELILLVFFFVMKCVHAKLVIFFYFKHLPTYIFLYLGEELVFSIEVHILDVRE